MAPDEHLWLVRPCQPESARNVAVPELSKANSAKLLIALVTMYVALLGRKVFEHRGQSSREQEAGDLSHRTSVSDFSDIYPRWRAVRKIATKIPYRAVVLSDRHRRPNVEGHHARSDRRVGRSRLFHRPARAGRLSAASWVVVSQPLGARRAATRPCQHRPNPQQTCLAQRAECLPDRPICYKHERESMCRIFDQ